MHFLETGTERIFVKYISYLQLSLASQRSQIIIYNLNKYSFYCCGVICFYLNLQNLKKNLKLLFGRWKAKVASAI